MSEAKPTHLAVHAIGYHDARNNAAEVKAGTKFHPDDLRLGADDLEDLEARGAVRRLTREDRKAENVDSDAQAAAKQNVSKNVK